ncbi:MAG: hypothetical protein DHS80DRAFT_23362 [Piptocephalis tieghemiana]|nr:MAG: hypothetical protein DHS80DRAFT_23362 [Piptocephalis tieghemiana]
MKSTSPILLLTTSLPLWPLVTAGTPSPPPPFDPDSQVPSRPSNPNLRPLNPTSQSPNQYPAHILSSLINTIGMNRPIHDSFAQLVPTGCSSYPPVPRTAQERSTSHPFHLQIPTQEALYSRLCNYLLDTSVSEDPDENYLLRMDLLYARSKALVDQVSRPFIPLSSDVTSPPGLSTPPIKTIHLLAHVDLQVHFPYLFLEYQKRQWSYLAGVLLRSDEGIRSSAQKELDTLMSYPVWQKTWKVHSNFLQALGKDESWVKSLFPSLYDASKDKYGRLKPSWNLLMDHCLQLLGLYHETDTEPGTPSASARAFQAQQWIKEIRANGLSEIKQFDESYASLYHAKGPRSNMDWDERYHHLEQYLQRLTMPLTMSALVQLHLQFSGSRMTRKDIHNHFKYLLRRIPDPQTRRMIGSALYSLVPLVMGEDRLSYDAFPLYPNLHYPHWSPSDHGKTPSWTHSSRGDPVARIVVKDLLPIVTPLVPAKGEEKFSTLYGLSTLFFPTSLSVHLLFHLHTFLNLRFLRAHLKRDSELVPSTIEWLQCALPQTLMFKKRWDILTHPLLRSGLSTTAFLKSNIDKVLSLLPLSQPEFFLQASASLHSIVDTLYIPFSSFLRRTFST